MAPQLQGKWVKIHQNGTSNDAGPGARSSQGIAVVGDKMYSFGGEFRPQTPLDNDMYVFDLKTHTWSVAPATCEKPTPRIGAGVAAVGSTIYVFGGRDPDGNRNNDFYAYDTLTNEWKRLSSGDPIPTARSYMSMTADDDQNVYVFGGVATDYRLKTLHGYNVVEQKWVQYPTPGESCGIRGGAGLALVNGKLWVVYGFCGHEMDDIHCFDLAKGEWTQVETFGEKPSARSMFTTAVVGKHILIFGGELEPSPLMHKGAGALAGEVYGLDTETLAWKHWKIGAKEVRPSRRGWCGFATAVKDGKKGLLLYGGNSPTNDRLDDIFFFTPY